MGPPSSVTLTFLLPLFLRRSLGSIHSRWVRRHWPGPRLAVVSLCSPSLGPARCHWVNFPLSLGHNVVVGCPSLCSCSVCLGGVCVSERSGRCSGSDVGGGCYIGFNIISGRMEERGIGENEVQRKSYFVFVTYPSSLPFPRSPLVVLLPQFLRRAMMHSPHPFGKGRGGCGGVLASEAVVVLKYRKVTRPGIEPRTFWTYTRCSNQLSYPALEFNQLILYLCNCQPKDTYSARHIQCHSLHARSTL